MSYSPVDFDEDIFKPQPWVSADADEPYADLHQKLRELEDLTAKPRRKAAPAAMKSIAENRPKAKRHYAFVALVAFVASLLLLAALVFGAARSQEFPLSYLVAFFISFGTAVALLSESRGPQPRKSSV